VTASDGGSDWTRPRPCIESLLALSGLLLAPMLARPVQGQELPPFPSSSPTAKTAQQLAKEALNPFSDYVKIPIESVTGFAVGPSRKSGESANIEPVLPFALGQEWDLIIQPRQVVGYGGPPCVGRDEDVALGTLGWLIVEPEGASLRALFPARTEARPPKLSPGSAGTLSFQLSSTKASGRGRVAGAPHAGPAPPTIATRARARRGPS